MKKFKDFMEDVEDKGSYVSVKPSEFAKSLIYDLCREMGLAHAESDSLHCTLMYSPYVSANYRPDTTKKYQAELGELSLYGPNKDFLVVELISPALQARHEELKALGLVHSYDEYRPHITLVEGYYKSIPLNLLSGMIVHLSEETIEDIL